MTIGSWLLFGFLALIIGVIGCCIAFVALEDSKLWVKLVAVGITLALIAGLFCGIRWYMTNTAAGQRAFKSQKSNLNGGLYRVVTVYSYDGDVLGRWEGQFDVTDNDQETYFDIDGKRVIIQNGIIINEEVDQ